MQIQAEQRWQLLKETVRQADKKTGRKADDILRGLPEALLGAILEGSNYPMEIYTAMLRRIRIEGQVSYLKAAIIKAALTRNYAMNDEHEQGPSYRLARLLAVLLEALKSGFELDRSAGRGLMSCQRLILFEHNSELGNAPAHKLFESVKIAKRVEVPRSYTDYEVTIGEVPQGVTVIEKI